MQFTMNILRPVISRTFSTLLFGFLLGYLTFQFKEIFLLHIDNSGSSFGDESEESFTSPAIVASSFGKVRPWRLLCWVLTTPRYHRLRADHVKKSWGRKCHITLYMSSRYDPELPTISLNITEGRTRLWGKTKAALTLLYDKYLEEADFFLKADDDTYIIVENLLGFLQDYHPDEHLYAGCQFKNYMSGGAGYVLSRATLRKLGEEGLPRPDRCVSSDIGDEDLELGRCLENINIPLTDTRDGEGRHRFLPLRPMDHLNPGRIDKMRYSWFWSWIKYRPIDGPEGISEYPISFHYIDHQDFAVFDYFLYKAKTVDNFWGSSISKYEEDKL